MHRVGDFQFVPARGPHVRDHHVGRATRPARPEDGPYEPRDVLARLDLSNSEDEAIGKP